MSEENKTEDKANTVTAKRNEKKAIVKKWLDSKPEGLKADLKEAIEYLAGMGARSQGMVNANKLKEMLEAGTVTALQIFDAFEYGRLTMDKKSKDFLKVSDPADRIWVARDEAGSYSIVGKGARKPKDWTGFIPEAPAITETL